MTDEEFDKWIIDRPKLKCRGKNCNLHSGFFVPLAQKEEILKRKCLLCNSDVVESIELRLIGDKDE